MPPTSALLLLDVQQNYLEGKTAIPDAAIVASNISKVIEKARSSNPRPIVVWVRNCGETGDPDQPNTPGWQLYFTPESPPEIIVDKTRNNAFDRAKLDPYIPKDVELFIAGMQSEFDVKYTCDSGLERGNKVALIKGAHGTFHTEETRAPRIQNDTESELEDAGVRIVTVADVVFGSS